MFLLDATGFPSLERVIYLHRLSASSDYLLTSKVNELRELKVFVKLAIPAGRLWRHAGRGATHHSARDTQPLHD